MVAYIARALDYLKGQRGQALAEYSLILAFVALACVVALGLLGLALAGQIDALTAGFP